jgi:hypothetical protein
MAPVPGNLFGDDLDAAIDAHKHKQAYFEALDANVPAHRFID